MKALGLIVILLHSGMGTVKIVANRKVSTSILEKSDQDIIIALLNWHKGERLSQKKNIICKNITDFSATLIFYCLSRSHFLPQHCVSQAVQQTLYRDTVIIFSSKIIKVNL